MPALHPTRAVAGPPLTARAESLGLAGALLLFVALAALRAWDHPVPFYDDVAYLDAAARIRESGGLLALVSAMFHGAWAEDNRNPLYLALLSLVAGRDLGFHLRAQVLGIALGAAALIASWFSARRLFGARAALWVALLLASSETLVAWSSREACEPLLLLFAALAFERLMRDSPSRAALALGGLFAGFAQLAKGTGIFIAFAACAAIAWERFAREGFAGAPDQAGSGPQRSSRGGPRPGSPLARLRAAGFDLACVVGGLLAGGLPLFVRNQLRFHSPLHNYNDRFLWIDPLDDFSEVFAPGAMARLDRGPLAYLRALTPQKALLRAGRGLGETLVHVGDSLSLVSPRPFGPVHIGWIALGLVAAALSVRLAARWPRGFRRRFFFAHAALMFSFFVFYNAVSGSSRYLLPLALTLLFPLAEALASAPLEGRWRAKMQSWPGRAAAAIALAVLLAVALDPREHQAPPGFEAAFTAIRARVAPGEAFAVDARSHLQPYWAMDPRVRMEILSTSWGGELLSADAQLAGLRARGVRWVVIDGTSRKGELPRWFFARELPLLPDGSLPIAPERDSIAALPALRVAWSDPGTPRRFALLELLPAAP